MNVKPLRTTLFGGAVVALAGLVFPLISAAQSTERAPEATPAVIVQKPAVVAQAPASAAGQANEIATIDVVAADEVRPTPRRGIRWGVLEGADAARVYNLRKQRAYTYNSGDFTSRK